LPHQRRLSEGAAKTCLDADELRLGLGNVRFLNFQPEESLSDLLAVGDVHIVSLKRGLEGFIVPSKVYGIIAAGRPLFAAVTSDSEPTLIIEECGCGAADRAR